MKKEETILQDKIRAYLNKHKIFHIRYSAQSTANGLPDLIICYRGRFIGCELKTPDGEPTDLQLKKLEAIRASGGIGILASSLQDILLVFFDIIDRGCSQCPTNTDSKE